MPDYPGLFAAAAELGLEPRYAVTASTDDFDRYEWRWSLNGERYAAAHPDEPGVEEFLAFIRNGRRRYVELGGRETLGFGLFLFERVESSTWRASTSRPRSACASPRPTRRASSHNSNYFVWFEVARVEYLERYAGGYQRLRDEGIESLVLESHARFLRRRVFDDRLLVHARCLDVRGARFRFEYAVDARRHDDRRRLDGARDGRRDDAPADADPGLARRGDRYCGGAGVAVGVVASRRVGRRRPASASASGRPAGPCRRLAGFRLLRFGFFGPIADDRRLRRVVRDQVESESSLPLAA